MIKVVGIIPITRIKGSILAAGLLRSMCDHVVGLIDDKSITRKESQTEVAELFKFFDNMVIAAHVITPDEVGPPWNDYINRLRLLAEAARYDAEWVVMLDDDELFEPGYEGEDLRNDIEQAIKMDAVRISMPVREIWQVPASKVVHYRYDGVWGRKSKVVVFRNPMRMSTVTWLHNPSKALHCFPVAMGRQIMSSAQVFHWGSYSRQMREARHAKYKKIDPNNVHQEMGYDYMLDDSQLNLGLASYNYPLKQDVRREVVEDYPQLAALPA